MKNLFLLDFCIRNNNYQYVNYILCLVAIIFMTILYTPLAFSADGKSPQKPEWAVCMPFAKAANAQRQITAEALEQEFKKFTPPEKEDVSKERAAYLELLRTTLSMGYSIEQWQWKSLKETVDEIYAGQVTAKKMEIDVNNNGLLEHVVEFRSINPCGGAGINTWNIILDDSGGFHKDFMLRTGKPIVVGGELRVFNMKTYLFDIGVAYLNPTSGKIKSLPFIIYRPSKSAMMKNSGISSYGAGPLCEFEVIHEQEKVQ